MPFAEPYFVKSVRSAAAPARRRRSGRRPRTTSARSSAPRAAPPVQPTSSWPSYPRLAPARGLDAPHLRLARRAPAASASTWPSPPARRPSPTRWPAGPRDHLGEFFAGADPVPATLYLWHLAEEVEHKSAAFDVYEASRRLSPALRLRHDAVVLDPGLVLHAGHAGDALRRRARLPPRQLPAASHAGRFSFAFIALPTMMGSALPGHHPSSLADPIWLSAWLTHFDPETGTLPEPTGAGRLSSAGPGIRPQTSGQDLRSGTSGQELDHVGHGGRVLHDEHVTALVQAQLGPWDPRGDELAVGRWGDAVVAAAGHQRRSR